MRTCSAGASRNRAVAPLVDRRDLRIFVHQPFGRRRRWRAEHDFQPGIAEHVDRPSSQSHWNSPRRGSMRDHANSPMRTVGDAHFAHAPGVLGPTIFRPVFRVVADAEHGQSDAPQRATLAGRAPARGPSDFSPGLSKATPKYASGASRRGLKFRSIACRHPAPYCASQDWRPRFDGRQDVLRT